MQTNSNPARKANQSATKTALITGASSGLGVEFAERLAARKVDLVLAARRRGPMEELAADLRRKYGVAVHVEPIDLAVPGAAARLKGTLDQKQLSIDLLINNAGYGLHGDFLDTPLEKTTDMIQLNLVAVTELSYEFGRDMAARGSGEILLIASILGFQPVPTYAAYAASKAYILSFGEALHDELRARGVDVTTLCPGHTQTGFDAAAGAYISPMLRRLTMQPRPVVDAGLRALSQKKASIIPGLLNNLIAFSNRLTSRSMQSASMKKVMAP
jgi:short-subunit dehydrogenase